MGFGCSSLLFLTHSSLDISENCKFYTFWSEF
ncbi:hypothetical protein V6Z12_A12G069900 [Gossypium hirsutum]